MLKKITILLIIVFLGLGLFYLLSQRNSTDKNIIETDIKKESKKDDSKISLPRGKQTYRVSMEDNSPQFYEVIIDPVDVHIGDTQSMEAKVRDANARVISVIAEVETDTGVKTYPLELVSGKNSDGAWKGSWIVHDTHDKTYRTTFIATNELKETSSVTLTWSDPCNPPPGGDWILTGDCNFGVGTINGADNGNIDLNGYSLIVDSSSTVVWNPNFSIILGSGSSIVINTTGQIKKTYLWMSDQDDDGWPTDRYQVASDTMPPGYYVRRWTLKVIDLVDCNDSDPNLFQEMKLYPDNDKDSYFAKGDELVCTNGTIPESYSATPGSDCDDNDSSVFIEDDLCFPDVDDDDYCPAGYTYERVCRGNTIPPNYGVPFLEDCDDNNKTITYKTSYYYDNDEDGFGSSFAGEFCAGTNPPNTVRSHGDCNDSDPNVHPGQWNYFSAPDSRGSYDYNCDGVEQIAPWSECFSLGPGPGCFQTNLYPPYTQLRSGWVVGSMDDIPSCGEKATWRRFESRLDSTCSGAGWAPGPCSVVNPIPGDWYLAEDTIKAQVCH